MKSVSKVICLAIGLLGAATLTHAAVQASVGTVKMVFTYGDFGGGDFTFRLSSQPQGCPDGYWISKSQPGFASSVAVILQAKAAGEALTVGGETNQLWSGSSGAFCKLNYVGVIAP